MAILMQKPAQSPQSRGSVCCQYPDCILDCSNVSQNEECTHYCSSLNTYVDVGEIILFLVVLLEKSK